MGKTVVAQLSAMAVFLRWTAPIRSKTMLSPRSQPEFRTPRRGSGWNIQNLGQVDPGTLCSFVERSATPSERQELQAFLAGDESALSERTRQQLEARLLNLLSQETPALL
jgi:hypothetical protein